MFRTLLLAAVAIGATTLFATPAKAAVDAQLIIQPRIVIGNPQPVVEKRVIVERERRPVVRERVVVIEKHKPPKKVKVVKRHPHHPHRHPGHHHHADQVVVIRR